MISSRQRRQLLGIGLLSLAAFTLLSLIPVSALGDDALRVFSEGNVMGVLGAMFARAGIIAVGIGIIMVPAILGAAAAAFFDWIEDERALRVGALMLGLALLVPAFAALFARDSGYAIAEVLPAGSTGWVGRTLTLPFAALLGRFGAALALLALLVALSVATIGWNPLGAAVRRMGRVLRRDADSPEPANEPEPAPEPVLAGVAMSPEPAVVEPEVRQEKPSLVPRLLRRKSAGAIVLEDT